MITTVKTVDGVLPVKPMSYVLGNDWTYMYSDDWKGVDFNVYACMNGEVVAVVEGQSRDYFFLFFLKKTIDKMRLWCYN